MPFGFHPWFLIVLLVIVLIIFGPGKLPDLGGAIGRGMREFRKASSDLTAEVREEFANAPKPSPQATTVNPSAATTTNPAEPEKSSNDSPA